VTTHLKPNEIFVFGSNQRGAHARGRGVAFWLPER